MVYKYNYTALPGVLVYYPQAHCKKWCTTTIALQNPPGNRIPQSRELLGVHPAESGRRLRPLKVPAPEMILESPGCDPRVITQYAIRP